MRVWIITGVLCLMLLAVLIPAIILSGQLSDIEKKAGKRAVK